MSDDLLKNPIKAPKLDPEEALGEMLTIIKKSTAPEPYDPSKLVHISLSLTLVELIAVARKLQELKNEKVE